jgi:isoamylase
MVSVIEDGASQNFSWNCGIEGPSDDAGIEELRNRQIKNFLVLLLFSIGTPMLQMGDEVRRSQQGNNNAYCQDGPISWFDWNLVDQHAISASIRQGTDRPAHQPGVVQRP